METTQCREPNQRRQVPLFAADGFAEIVRAFAHMTFESAREGKRRFVADARRDRFERVLGERQHLARELHPVIRDHSHRRRLLKSFNDPIEVRG